MANPNNPITAIAPIPFGRVVDAEKPVLLYRKYIKDTMGSAAHAHPRGQFIFSTEGITRVVTSTGVYLIPSSQAFWCPPNHKHELFFLGEVNIANLFIDPAWAKSLPSDQQVFNVSPLVRELILKATEIGPDYSPIGKERRLMEVIIDEIAELTHSPLKLPWSEHPKLSKIMRIIFDNPINNNSIEQWADYVHTSTRTLARMFKKEVNMTFSGWRMQVRLFYALEKLHEGEPVTSVAMALGYSSASAFISAFKRNLGQSPLEYIAAKKK
ncbi:AraC family transcriptional regulator [Sinobacterium caligoides]|uniref:AraC family transcriptional regulator n=1 Tax=Sinobacterium caligoides TaxID=933926 RepID=A0A3N2D585_9GAMM|nr:helix-turn-helix transcriptional regulator [Sinobacterium caligoides]ROR94913.1 AraC family transcriptional regulator [Sinobacterium caligoides]